ncbi:YybH family protein [Plasticicumulans sp.]|uniref:YybH family protein n=1 Tax=Plasticicumulans sp. TaxID=2307179 RepID=UPI003932F96E
MNTQTQNTQTQNTQTHSEVLAVLETWLDAIRAGDLDAIGRHYAADVSAYDAVGPLRFQGRPAYAEHWRRCLEFCEGETIYEPQPPAVFADSQLAVVHFLLRCGKRKADGSEESSWMRTTLGLRCEAGSHWLIFHEHSSIPFDMESGQTQFGLTP